jgi:hypothetical protein
MADAMAGVVGLGIHALAATASATTETSAPVHPTQPSRRTRGRSEAVAESVRGRAISAGIAAEACSAPEGWMRSMGGISR